MKEIVKLPVIERLLVIENAMKSIREETLAKKRNLKEGAKALFSDYTNDKELTAFTSLDSEEFHEAE